MTQAQYTYWYENKYSTHDWLAESALDAITTNPLTNSKWVDGDTTFWTKERKLCYLIGTEVPDALPEQEWRQSKHTRVELPWVRVVLNGEVCCGESARPYHRFYVNSPGDSNRMRPKSGYTSVELHAKSWTTKVINYLKTGRCDAAAFYMGALSHLIADAANFVHTVEVNDLTGLARRYRNTVSEYYEDAVKGVTSDHDNRGEFFDVHKTFLAIPIEPKLAIKFMAFDARWDYTFNIINYYDYFTMPYPSWVQPGPKDAAQLIEDYVNDCHCARSAQEWSSSFKAESQDHLNKAIEYTAGIIEYFAQFWNKQCECNSNSNTQEASATTFRQFSLMLVIVLVMGLSNTLLWPLPQMLLYATAAP